MSLVGAAPRQVLAHMPLLAQATVARSKPDWSRSALADFAVDPWATLTVGVLAGVVVAALTLTLVLRLMIRRFRDGSNQLLEQRIAERTQELVQQNERLLEEVRGLRTTESRLRCAQATLEETTQKYAILSQIDPLTNLANRRKFDEFLEREWRRGVRHRKWLSLLIVDVDYFKLFNDTYGHGTGDDCLRAIAEVLGAAARRPGDLAARIGGEEFAVLLCDTGPDGAATVAQQIQSAISRLAIAHEATRVIGADCITVSIGSDSMLPEHNSNPGTLLSRADEALYAAKQEGRNCVRTYDEYARNLKSESALRTAPNSLRIHESLGRRSRP